ncbi:MAG: indolepyruvate ferredoxin oxidoreductase subunit alpha [Smithella sp.]|nr:indolepyruvate ferredoxin oxidoreductase subunit alpha [Smithella sp.]MDM7988754.1 indolepyruvate ferredoxin oxidoreductase subunit alpha [Smithella sp.]HOU51138.1 indolepyruvate ferredoxin oxidoreductase subunit alpha [Smithella sp.]HQG65035.1 indolepyruvate ferredoxin oxidoreductase subunit alpha [Smithella sp.]HQH16076.1 indolepyruvate ferredoxin oxidoreductase subunit alpha [Smithella sp.]
MNKLLSPAKTELLCMGNEAIARGALEAGLNVVAGYPGTPSSEVIERLSEVARDRNLYVEWSTNEKVALEVAAAASFAGLRSMCVMKQNGVNVASDFLLHLASSGTRGGIVLIECEDPGALSSVNEGESRYFARMLEIPLLEPATLQEAKDLTRWAFELSEKIRNVVILRSVTRMSHASGNVICGRLPVKSRTARFIFDGSVMDPLRGPVVSTPVVIKHGLQQKKLETAAELFEKSPFNGYYGSQKPELLIITSSACFLYSREAIEMLNLQKRVGILKLSCTWPLPQKLLKKYFRLTKKIMIVEEVLPFLEENVKVAAMGMMKEIGGKTFFGKMDKTLPSTGELNPEIVATALSNIMKVKSKSLPADYVREMQKVAAIIPPREQTFCPGCPHRASFWNINTALKLDGRDGIVCGDIGCYSMASLSPAVGFHTVRTLHSMGSGTGLASGFAKLQAFGLDQPVMSICGDSTFYHAVIPALINAQHNRADITFIVLDNAGTAMTGFQPHPGINQSAIGEPLPSVDIAGICEAIGAKVAVCDPFDLEATSKILTSFMAERGSMKVLIMKQACALSPEKKGRKQYQMSVNEELCLGDNCGCNRLCTRIFRCPALTWDRTKKKAVIDEVICAGCGVCYLICPQKAITRTEAAR